MKCPPEKINPALEAGPQVPQIRGAPRPGALLYRKSGRGGQAGYSVCNRL